MYERLKRLYQQGRTTKEELYKAIGKGWITEEQYNEIVNG